MKHPSLNLFQLAKSAQDKLKYLDYNSILVKVGDGCQGWAEYALFDAIVVTAAPEEIPATLVNQLSMGGRFVPMVKGEE